MENTKPLRAKVAELSMGESVKSSVDDYSYATARHYACEIGFDLNRKFKVSLNRPERTFTITRTH